jgi:hypothetical protein
VRHSGSKVDTSARDPRETPARGERPSPAVPPAAACALRLQRTAGNQAVSRLLARTRQADAGEAGNLPVQRTLSWGGRTVAAYEDLPENDRDRIAKAIDGEYGMFVQPVVEAMIDDNVLHKVSIEVIVKEIPEIAELYFAKNMSKLSSNNPRNRIARRLLENDRQADRLQSKLKKTLHAELVPGRNLRGFNDFLDANPAFVDYLINANIGIIFRSSQARDLGGLYVHAAKTVHLEDGVEGTSPGIFLRLLLHEMGHASFQQMLMTTDPGVLNQDEQAFRDAWTVLRRNDGQYLLGLDLGQSGEPGARKKYQADDFMEFCAENFMHRVTAPDLLSRHLIAINKPSNRVPQDIRDAWRDAIAILDKYERLLLR